MSVVPATPSSSSRPGRSSGTARALGRRMSDGAATDLRDAEESPADDGGGSFVSTISIAVLVGGLVLTFALWFGLRAREIATAEGELDTLVASQATAVASELGAYLEALDGIAGVASLDDDLTDTELIRYLDSIHLVDRPAFTDVVITARVEGTDELAALTTAERAARPDFTPILTDTTADTFHIVTRRVAGDGLAAFAGVDIGANPVIAAGLAEAATSGRTVVFPLPTGAEDTGGAVDVPVVAASPVTDADGTVVGTVVGRIRPGVLLAELIGPDTEMALALDGVLLATTTPVVQLGQPVGAATELTSFGTELVEGWTAQGYSLELTPDHTGSTAVLVAGLVLTLTLALLVRAMSRYDATVRRLRRIEHHARHDRLTGLTNRAGLTEALRTRLEDRSVNEVVGVLFLDLDRLKVVNDSIGHSAGDELLQIVADRLAGLVRDTDVVGRFGGDEFVVITSGLRSVRDLTATGDRIMASLAEPAELSDGSTQMLGASIGISYVARGDASAESLLRDADVAMYRAKEDGGNRYVVFDAELRSRAIARLEIERELRRAIRSGQLIVHYQPIVSTHGGHIDRLEALVRWQHDTKGLVPPGQFLAVAAESGLIIEVGEHVLRESCRQASVWSAAVGRPIRVSVNVAERQLVETHLVDTVRRVLNETGLAPEQLELEITEELIVDNIDDRLEMLHELRSMGVLLAIDDFGTSRASLGQLKRLDMVTTLKIDRAFVMDLANDPVDEKIVTAIVALAKSMGMEVVAEGVEDTEQATKLRDLGVDLLQGFLFHRPAPADQMAPMLATQAEWLVASS